MPAINKIEVLRQVPIFSGLSDSELTELADLASERSFKSGEFIFWEGDAPDLFCVIVEGRIKVLKHSSTGKEFIIAFFSPGEMFGEVAVFQNKPYPASAQAAADTRVLGIKKADFPSFLSSHPDVALRIVTVLAGRLRDAQSRLKDLAGERVEQRIAQMLLMLSARLGSTRPFTRQEIADMTGIATRMTKDEIILFQTFRQLDSSTSAQLHYQVFSLLRNQLIAHQPGSSKHPVWPMPASVCKG